jgi:hypothetical protein
VIDRDGSIYSLMKDFQIARHAAGFDRHAIGITVVGTANDVLSDKQVVGTAMLVRYLKGKYAELAWLLSDEEAWRLQGSSLWEERLPASIEPARDPGPPFMTKLRGFVGDLELKGSSQEQP